MHIAENLTKEEFTGNMLLSKIKSYFHQHFKKIYHLIEDENRKLLYLCSK